MESFLTTAASVMVGGFVTWLVAQKYYVNASRDLKAETGDLRRMIVLLLLAMEKNEWIELSRSADGAIKGFVQRISVHGIPSTVTFEHPKVTQVTDVSPEQR